MKTPEQLSAETLELCDKIATFSADSSTIERFCLTPEMAQLHNYLQDYFADSLQRQTDNVGNVLFTPINAHTNPKRRVLIGSHLDTVSNAGKYDGIIGVVMGLLCAREYSNEGTEFNAIGFADEEGGRFGCRFLGSFNFIGELPSDYLPQQDPQGISLKQAMYEDKLSDFSHHLNDNSNTSFLELHIEQGLSLHQAEQSLGIVEQICGQAVVSFTFHGRTAHAVSKWGRQDALLSACELVSQAQKLALHSSDLHITFGYIDNAPNQSNVVSHRTTVKADVRHIDDDIRTATIEKIIALAEGISTLHSTELKVEKSEQKTVLMDSTITSNLHRLCQDNDIACQLMTSFAGHDALVMSAKVQTGFLFLRDDKGISHHPQESVDRQAITDAFSILQNY